MSLLLNLDSPQQIKLQEYAIRNSITQEEAALHIFTIGLDNAVPDDDKTDIPQDLKDLIGIVPQFSKAELETDARLQHIMRL